MSQAGVALRPTVLARELERRGLGHDVADRFAWHLTARAPFARRHGVEVLSREIARRGLDASAAHDTALMLLALELIDGGLPFGRVVQELRRWEGAAHSAWAEAMEAVRLARSLARPARPDASGVGDRLALAFLGVGIVALLACLVVVA